jgi:hypothetical protein
MVYLLADNGNVVHGNALAFALRENGFGTAVCHLLTPAERERAAQQRRVPVGTALLTRRLMAAFDAVSEQADLRAIPAGITASGTAAAAALEIAALRPLALDAIVCRHARIACCKRLVDVQAPTLFLAVAGDLASIHPTTRAFQQLVCSKRFEIVAGTSSRFDDERSFALAGELTSAWMRRHIGRSAAARAPAISAEPVSFAALSPPFHAIGSPFHVS